MFSRDSKQNKCFFKKQINKLDKPLQGLVLKMKKKKEFSAARIKKDDINTDHKNPNRTMFEHYVSKFKQLDAMGKFLEKYNLPKLR